MIRFNPGVKVPWFVRVMYKKALWRIKTSEKIVYLTFDDGPIPEITPWVLQLLKKENIKASFFCVGENVKKYPEVFQLVKDEGHSFGNHTFNHMQGLKTSISDYLANIEKASQLIISPLFRPPHGLLKWGQYRKLKEKYQLVMWDIVSRDFDKQLTATEVYNNVIDFIRPGSIIVFHDSIKAEKNMKKALPEVIKTLKEQGYRFETIPVPKSSDYQYI